MYRLTIEPKEVAAITGKSVKYARNLLDNIRKKYNKEKHQSVTIKEFCTYQGLHEAEVRTALGL